jgi:hypothetical protein
VSVTAIETEIETGCRRLRCVAARPVDSHHHRPDDDERGCDLNRLFVCLFVPDVSECCVYGGEEEAKDNIFCVARRFILVFNAIRFH